MMTEYIERKALMDAKFDALVEVIDGETYAKVSDVADFVLNFPAADVAPVVHGRWEPIERKNMWGDDVGVLQCSACKRSDVKGRGIVRKSNFCPNCGADMREVE